jgi:thiamine kinase-like enzyme
MTPGDHLTSLPCWHGPIRAEPLSGGLSNEAWKVWDQNGIHVARFGGDYPVHHVDRAREAMAARAAHAAGFGPRLEYAGPGVSVVEFIASRTWTAADACAAPDRIGELLLRFHHQMPAEVSGPGHMFWPFHVVRDYARTMRADNSPYAVHLPDYLDLNTRLEATQIPQPIVFGHHDILPANLLDDGKRLWLIDYEYACFGTPLFDLAGAASNAAMNEAQTEALLISYFGAPPDAPLRRAFDGMICASLLREAMWSMVSDQHLSAPGADYRGYAQENLDRLARALGDFHTRHGYALT